MSPASASSPLHVRSVGFAALVLVIFKHSIYKLFGFEISILKVEVKGGLGYSHGHNRGPLSGAQEFALTS